MSQPLLRRFTRIVAGTSTFSLHPSKLTIIRHGFLRKTYTLLTIFRSSDTTDAIAICGWESRHSRAKLAMLYAWEGWYYSSPCQSPANRRWLSTHVCRRGQFSSENSELKFYLHQSEICDSFLGPLFKKKKKNTNIRQNKVNNIYHSNYNNISRKGSYQGGNSHMIWYCRGGKNSLYFDNKVIIFWESHNITIKICNIYFGNKVTYCTDKTVPNVLKWGTSRIGWNDTIQKTNLYK